MKKARIIERTFPDGTVEYYIQKKCLWWYDVCEWDARFDTSFAISFDTLEDARQNLCYYDGTKIIDKVIY